MLKYSRRQENRNVQTFSGPDFQDAFLWSSYFLMSSLRSSPPSPFDFTSLHMQKLFRRSQHLQSHFPRFRNLIVRGSLRLLQIQSARDKQEQIKLQLPFSWCILFAEGGFEPQPLEQSTQHWQFGYPRWWEMWSWTQAALSAVFRIYKCNLKNWKASVAKATTSTTELPWYPQGSQEDPKAETQSKMNPRRCSAPPASPGNAISAYLMPLPTQTSMSACDFRN